VLTTAESKNRKTQIPETHHVLLSLTHPFEFAHNAKAAMPTRRTAFISLGGGAAVTVMTVKTVILYFLFLTP
jgi:hypothetical protein